MARIPKVETGLSRLTKNPLVNIYAQARLQQGLLLVVDVALLLNRTERWVRENVTAGTAPCTKIDRFNFVFTWENIREFMDNLAKKTEANGGDDADPAE